MPLGLLSLPDELLVQIFEAVLVTPTQQRVRITQPKTRFTYRDPPWRTPQSPPRRRSTLSQASASSTIAFSPGPATRSRAYAALPQRPYNPFHTRTTISCLFVCRHLRALATPFFYSNRAWEIGIHDRAPTISIFRSFLDDIGPVARPHIRSIVVLSRFGYNCLWDGLPSAWITQLGRCTGLRNVWVSMSQSWVDELEGTEYPWTDKFAKIWRLKGLSNVQEVHGWSLGFGPDYVSAGKQRGLIPDHLKNFLKQY